MIVNNHHSMISRLEPRYPALRANRTYHRRIQRTLMRISQYCSGDKPSKMYKEATRPSNCLTMMNLLFQFENQGLID